MASPKGSGCLPRGTRCHPQGALCHLHRAPGAIPKGLWVPFPWRSGCYPQGLRVPSLWRSGCYPQGTLGAIPIGLCLPSPPGLGCHPSGALGTIPMATQPLRRRGTSQRQQGSRPRGCLWGERSVPPPQLCPYAGCWDLPLWDPPPCPSWGPKGPWGLCQHASGCDPKGCQRCSLTQAKNPGGDVHL